MAKIRKSRYKKDPGGRLAARVLLLLMVLVAGMYFFFKSGGKAPVSVPGRGVSTPISSSRKDIPTKKNIVPLPPSGPTNAKTTTQCVEDKLPVNTSNAATGRLAIIIDDMGSSLQEARSLAGIGVPLTFSIIPGLRMYREVADFAGSSEIEVIVHIPMQPKGWPQRRLEANGLLLSMSDNDIRERLESYLRYIPRAVGANNHMGSEFTEHEDKMRVVLEVLKGKGLFFIDSWTSPQTVGLKLAKESGIKSGRRGVFLDNEQDGSYIRRQLMQAVRQAKKTGTAIAICHPHPATISTLTETLPALEKQGILLVTASKLVK